MKDTDLKSTTTEMMNNNKMNLNNKTNMIESETEKVPVATSFWTAVKETVSNVFNFNIFKG